MLLSPLTPTPKNLSSIQIGPDIYSDFLIIGAGIAGASLALKLSKLGKVTLLCKDSSTENNTYYAQGGIASVLLKSDSFTAHIQDTIIAGAGLCHPEVVQKVVENGPEVIQELINMGVPFTPSKEESSGYSYHLTREGGHTARRVIHAADFTGKAVQNTLVEQILNNPNITLYDYHMAIDLIVTDKVNPDFSRNRALGAYVLNQKTNTIHSFIAYSTFIATGGHGKTYLYSSNPDVATGDGVAMAKRAGARVANLEFMQFHPTCLYNPKTKNFLISEALRGEGAILLSKTGERFLENVDPRKELAPRDIVARAIDAEIKRTGQSYVLLDISHKDPNFIKDSFPNIYQKCLEINLDITKDPIPVVPAAHYSCGGIVTDIQGRTGIKGLWALGEAACTGLHGANRLASNSLLEGLVFAKFIYKDLEKLWPEIQKNIIPKVPSWQLGSACDPDEMVVTNHLWDEIRRSMWNYVGIVRSEKRLARAEARILQITQEIENYYWNIVPERNLLEVRNLATVAMLTVKCARMRKESRGIHYSINYPESSPIYFQKDTVLG